MSYFSIKNKKIQSSSASFVRLAKSIRSYETTVSSVSNNLGIDSSVRANLQNSLKRVSSQILSEAATLDSFSQALDLIALEYQKTEDALLGKDVQYNKQSNTQFDIWKKLSDAWNKLVEKAREDFRYFLLKLGLVKAEKQTREEGKPVTKRQEYEMDRYMKNVVTDLRKDPRFSEETWRNASVDERKKILQEYLNNIYTVMGLPRVNIEWSNTEPENGYVTMGYYSDNDNSVHINEWVISQGDKNGFSSYSLVSTVAHEMRHYYQHEAITHPENYIVTEETINRWQDSFDNYRGQEDFMRDFGMTEREAFEAYQNQAVEEDARWFADQ